MEFQAIVMAAGKGSRITEILSGLPKCLLPIGNVPMIKSCLHSLKDLNVRNTLVLVPEADKMRIQDAIDLKGDSKVEFIGIAMSDEWGTADSLRMIHDKIKHDVIILSCDLISSFNLHKMAIQHRKNDADLTMLLTPLPKTIKDASVPGHKGKHKPEKDIVGIEKDGRIIFFNSEADFEEGLTLKVATLRKHSCFNVFSNLLDAHVYMIKKTLVDFILASKHVSTIKGELLPIIMTKKFNKKSLPSNGSVGYSKESDLFKDIKSLALELSSSNDQLVSSVDGCENSLLKCYAYVEREALCLRANTLVGYMEVNRQISKNMEAAMGLPRKLSSLPKSQVDNDSILGEDVKLMTKSSIKQSVIGSNCSISEKAKVSGSIVMDNVVIQSCTSVSGCIICSNVSIGSNCELKNCIVGSDQKINDGTKLVNEVVQGTYQLMEI